MYTYTLRRGTKGTVSRRKTHKHWQGTPKEIRQMHTNAALPVSRSKQEMRKGRRNGRLRKYRKTWGL